MWGLLDAIKLLNLVKGVDTWGQTSMEAEDLVLNNSCEWEVVEQLSELFPDIGVSVLTQAFIIESIPTVKRMSQILIQLNPFERSPQT